MATLKVNTLSGIGTEGVVLDGGLKFRSLNYMTLPKGDTTQRGRGRAASARFCWWYIRTLSDKT